MRIIEENQLEEVIRQLNNYQKCHEDLSSFYNDLESLELPSLQVFSFEKDKEFLDEVSFILSVIISIISKPQIQSKGEDIIIRSDLAGHISSDSFQKVFKDSKLWKEKNLKMIPEYVHHYQYTDNLRIYENLFVGMLIDLINYELIKYVEFYNLLIPSINSANKNELLENEIAETMLTTISNLQRKVNYIKNSYFYKEVSKEKLSFKNIQPTNILVKNKLYNYCYRFYRKFMQYIDNGKMVNNLRLYYYYLLIQNLHEMRFTLTKNSKQEFDNLNFKLNDCKLNLKLANDNKSIKLKIKMGNIIPSANYYITIGDGTDISEENTQVQDLLSIEYVSIWNVKDSEELKPYFENIVTEKLIAKQLLLNKLETRKVKKMVYTKFCPVCKSKNLSEENNMYYCNHCKSVYAFYDNSDVVWFSRLRRS